MSEPCPVCKKPFGIKRKRKLLGLPPLPPRKCGRPRIRNNEEIKMLRKRGLSMREIAKEIGLSTTAVQRGLKADR